MQYIAECNRTREIISKLLDKGFDHNSIVSTIKCSYSLISKISKAKATNTSYLLSFAAPQKRKVTPAIEQYVEQRSHNDPTLRSADLVSEIWSAFQVRLTRKWVDHIRAEFRFRFRHRINTFVLTDQHKATRLAFANQHANTNWDNVLFTDESYFEIGNSGQMVWRRAGDTRPEVLAYRQSHPLKVMVWAGISKAYNTPILIFRQKQTMTADVYVQEVFENTSIIQDLNTCYPGGWVFQQDNAPPHTARSTKAFFAQKNIVVLQNWPPHSPDLNVIENIWAYMKHAISRTNPQTLATLIACIKDCWHNLPVRVVHNLIDSIPGRLNKVIANNGAQIL